MCRKTPIYKGFEWLCRNLIHAMFVCVAVIFFAVPLRASSQRDGVIYEKVAEQERHIDASDTRREEEKKDFQEQINKVREKADEDHETLDEYRFAFYAVTGLLTLVNLVGFRMQFYRGKESNG